MSDTTRDPTFAPIRGADRERDRDDTEIEYTSVHL